MRKYIENIQVLNAFFTLVFSDNICFYESQDPEASGKVWRKKVLPSAEEVLVRELLNKLNIYP